jgi:hypothetical protein
MNKASFRESIFSPRARQSRNDEAWLRANGIPDFETVGDTEARHLRMVSSFYKFGLDVVAKDFAACNAAGCKESCTTDACHWKTRNRRLKAITSGSRLFAAEKGPTYFLTLIRPEWQVAPDRLYELKIVDLRKRVQELLRKAGVELAVGSFEVSYNRQINGPAYWAGNAHVVCAGVEKADLFEALRVQPWAECARPLQVKRVGNVTRCLGYTLKRFPHERREYLDATGRRNRNSLPLTSSDLYEHDCWLAGVLAGSRTILVGARQNANGSIRRIGSRANRRIRRGSG